MTLQEMAPRVLQAKADGDLRFEMFVNALAARTGMSVGDVVARIHFLAVGVPL